MCEVISQSNVTYSGPSYNALRTTLLDDVKKKVEAQLADWEQHARKTTGFVLTSDGWTDAQNRPLLNFILCSPRGQKFLHVLDTSGHEKTGAYIAEQLSQVIQDVGPQYISAVIMDGASNNVSANEILEEE